MAKGIPLRGDYDGDAKRIGGVELQVVRNWVLRFNERGPNRLIDRKAPGKRPKLTAVQLQELAAIVDMGLIPYICTRY